MTNEKVHSTFFRWSKENHWFERKRDFMKFAGYWASVDSGKVVLERTVFDETELDPATNWKQAWQNQDSEERCKGYVDLDAALVFAARMLSAVEGCALGPTEMALATRFDPNWVGDRCEIQSIACLLGSIPGDAPTQSI